ncbi:MAG: MoaD/ThiS family protein [Proteobacteria bacterium]|nr:MoaD/ThiS family protein [Pseudomonadota bacterium]
MMPEAQEQQTITINIFGFLRRHMDEQGLPYTLERTISEEGSPAYDVALGLSLPPEQVEAVFCNGRVINIYDRVFPGDRVAFCPYGTPGPYRVFLGIVRENRERARREGKADSG